MAERNHKPHARAGKSETPKPNREFPYIRRLKVHRGQYYHQTLSNSCRGRLVPWVHIKGYWLEEAGFTVVAPPSCAGECQ